MAELHFLLAGNEPRQHGPDKFHAQACFVSCVMTDIAPQVLSRPAFPPASKKNKARPDGGFCALGLLLVLPFSSRPIL
jgi:hypothetical protein